MNQNWQDTREKYHLSCGQALTLVRATKRLRLEDNHEVLIKRGILNEQNNRSVLTTKYGNLIAIQLWEARAKDLGLS